ncbi:hypothetical protein MAQ5080_02958 [Marinomonas aquimarina]|uniref:NAD(P)-binding domain-containing protein n=1 Tax=Marinomonas aquimarina TaxID=295068 RepID=A0A1A8TNZ7_9GAMM|nr:NAD(P)H-binding protein [Marinomonas aquimarina]SBS34733.1 hypothetical protein MAQ5080_02958 [Marinomonas aquimarina]
MASDKHMVIIGASGKLGRYLVEEALAKHYRVTAVCRARSVHKLDIWRGLIDVVPAASDDYVVLSRILPKADVVITVLVPWGVSGYAQGTVETVLNFSKVGARLLFSCGWHIQFDERDQHCPRQTLLIHWLAKVMRWLRIADLQDQVEAVNRIFASSHAWTVVRASDLEEGESEGMPNSAEYVGAPCIAHNRLRRVDFAKFLLHAVDQAHWVQRAPAIAGHRLAPEPC